MTDGIAYFPLSERILTQNTRHRPANSASRQIAQAAAVSPWLQPWETAQAAAVSPQLQPWATPRHEPPNNPRPTTQRASTT